MEASRSLSGPQGAKFSGDKAAFLEDIRKVEHALTHSPQFIGLFESTASAASTLNLLKLYIFIMLDVMEKDFFAKQQQIRKTG